MSDTGSLNEDTGSFQESLVTDGSLGTFFDDSSVRYEPYCTEEDVGSLTQSLLRSPTQLRSILMSSASSTGTFFGDSSIRYNIICAGEDFYVASVTQSPIKSPTKCRSIISSFTESSTGTFLGDSSITDMLNSTMIDTEGQCFLDYLEQTFSSTGKYFEESSTRNSTTTFDRTQDDGSSLSISQLDSSLSEAHSSINHTCTCYSTHNNTPPITQLGGTLSELDITQDTPSSSQLDGSLLESNSTTQSRNGYDHFNVSDISFKNVTGLKLQISVPLKMFYKKLLKSTPRK